MKIKKTLLAAAFSGGLFSATSAHAALTLTLEGKGVYDSDLNITWLRDANLAATEKFGISMTIADTDFDWAEGRMAWYSANSWIGAMNAANYLGYSDWRLPTTVDPSPACLYEGHNIPGYSTNYGYNGTICGYNVDTAFSEMAHLWYDELGNKSFYDTSGMRLASGGLTNTGPFINLTHGNYWLGTIDNIYNQPWFFSTGDGVQFRAPVYDAFGVWYTEFNVWAVRDGDSPVVTSPVPEPETYAMLLAGLVLLSFTVRRRKQGA